MLENNEEVSARFGLSIQPVTILSFAPRHMQRVSTYVPNLVGFDAMFTNVLNAVIIPFEAANPHALSRPQWAAATRFRRRRAACGRGRRFDRSRRRARSSDRAGAARRACG